MDFNEQYYLEQATEEELNNLDWESISKYQTLSEAFIEKFKDRIDWEYISYYQVLSEPFIEKFADKVNWNNISYYQALSEPFIEKFADKVNWEFISYYQTLSEQFIEKFADKVDWKYISIFQKLSEEFIEQFRYEVDWIAISKYQKLSESFINKHKNKLIFNFIEDSWHYKDVEFKKQKVIETKLYECYDDYFIAYKGIRRDRYSNYNSQYKYEKGGAYESWADTSSEENSFGLSVWTEEDARNYCNQLIIRVKVRYEDVARVTHYGGKIRCFRLEVLD